MAAIAARRERRARGGPARRAQPAAARPGWSRSRGRAVVPVDIELDGRAAPARHHGAQRGRQDGDAQDPGPARADGAVGLPRARARRRAAARVLAGASPSSATTRAWRRTSRRSPRSSSSSGTCSSAWTSRSLVVLDELGAGTDPDDGAALAQAVLEELAERGALCVASTHLEPLKGFASTHPRARNASVEFDQERLAPTFRLVYDRPGQSYALAIGARLGLPPALIERAHGLSLAPSSDSSRSCWPASTTGIGGRPSAARRSSGARRRARGCSRGPQAELEAARASARETIARARRTRPSGWSPTSGARVNEEWERLRAARRRRPSSSGAASGVRDAAEGGAHSRGPPAPDAPRGRARGGRAIASRSRISGSRGRYWGGRRHGDGAGGRGDGEGAAVQARCRLARPPTAGRVRPSPPGRRGAAVEGRRGASPPDKSSGGRASSTSSDRRPMRRAIC